MIEPFALSLKASWPIPSDHEREGDPEHHGEDHHGDDRGKELASHHFTPNAVTIMSMSLMPMNGAMTPPAP